MAILNKQSGKSIRRLIKNRHTIRILKKITRTPVLKALIINNYFCIKIDYDLPATLIWRGKRMPFKNKRVELPLSKEVFKILKKGLYSISIKSHIISLNYDSAACPILFDNRKRYIINGKKYNTDRNSYYLAGFEENSGNLQISCKPVPFNIVCSDLSLIITNNDYKQLLTLELDDGYVCIKDLRNLTEQNGLLRLFLTHDSIIYKCIISDSKCEDISITSFYDDVIIDEITSSTVSLSSPLGKPIPGIMDNYKYIQDVVLDTSREQLTIRVKEKAMRFKEISLYLRNQNTNEAEHFITYPISRTIKVSSLDSLLDRTINYIDKYVLEFHIKDDMDNVVENSILRIKRPRKLKAEENVLYTAHDNQISFIDNNILAIENINNYLSYQGINNFDLKRNTFFTEITGVSSNKDTIDLSLSVRSVLSRMKRITVYLSDNYLHKDHHVKTITLEEASRSVHCLIKIGAGELSSHLYYNARMNFKLSVEYSGGFQENGFITAQNLCYTIKDRYIYTHEYQDDMVLSLYLGPNIHNLNLWYTSADEYEKGVSYQIGRERYMDTLKHESVDDKLIFFEANLGKNYTGNPKYLYEYMLACDRYSKYKYVWAYSGAKKDMIPGDPVLVERGTEDYFYYLAKAKYWINNILFPVKEKREETVYLQTWHGTPLKKLGFDIEVDGPEKKAFDNLYKESQNWDYLLTDNDFGEEKLVNAFHFRKKVIKKGYPINDIFYNVSLKEQAEKRLIDQYPEINGKKVILYAPTWRDLQGDYVRGYDFELPFDIQKLYEQIGDDYVVLLKLHHLVSDNLVLDSKYSDFIIDASSEEDIMELLCVTDILITDYSSVFFDFANAKKPMIFYVYDLDEYINKTRGLYFDINKLPGPVVIQEEDLINSIKDIDNYSYDNNEKLRDFCDKMSHYCHGKSSEDVLDMVIGETCDD